MTTARVKKLLHSFTGGSSDGETPVGDLVSLNGTLYGATSFGGTCRQGTVYSISTIGTEKLLHSFCGSDGWEPAAGLIDVNGMLYGTTLYGGDSESCGTVYRLSTNGTEKVLYRFKGGTELTRTQQHALRHGLLRWLGGRWNPLRRRPEWG
jgi:uncharacterized repeat protein (TIGR03803 family)